eukprot:1188103-Prorocentrum_minimum.AAC.2
MDVDLAVRSVWLTNAVWLTISPLDLLPGIRELLTSQLCAQRTRRALRKLLCWKHGCGFQVPNNR